MKFNKGSVFSVLAIVLFGAAIVIAILIFSGKLTTYFWFASIFAIAAGSTFLGQKNLADAQKATEDRRKARAEREKAEKDRYI